MPNKRSTRYANGAFPKRALILCGSPDIVILHQQRPHHLIPPETDFANHLRANLANCKLSLGPRFNANLSEIPESGNAGWKLVGNIFSFFPFRSPFVANGTTQVLNKYPVGDFSCPALRLGRICFALEGCQNSSLVQDKRCEWCTTGPKIISTSNRISQRAPRLYPLVAAYVWHFQTPVLFWQKFCLRGWPLYPTWIPPHHQDLNLTARTTLFTKTRFCPC